MGSFLQDCYNHPRSIIYQDTLDLYNLCFPSDTIIGTDTTICNDSICELVTHGLDCSMWQNKIHWDKIDSNYTFVFIKATQGLKIDPNFSTNWNGCQMVKGAYHFFNPNINGEVQAKYFLSIVPLKKGNLPPVIDVEYYRPYWKYCNKWTAARNLRLMLEYLEKKTGTKPIIYTNCNFWNKNLSPYIKFNPNDYYLWVANYRTNGDPCIPNGWSDWTFWQWSSKGKLDYHWTYWDLNYFKGDLNEIIIK